MSKIDLSFMEVSPSDKKITTGVLRSMTVHSKMLRIFPRDDLVPFRTPVCVHDTLCSPESTCEVCATIGFELQRGGQQLVRRTCEIVFYRGRRFVIEEDQAICVPSHSATLGIAVYGSLAGQPETVKGRKDRSKPVVSGGRDTVNPGRVGQWLPILLAHRTRSAQSVRGI
jgi:hypothetical protein